MDIDKNIKYDQNEDQFKAQNKTWILKDNFTSVDKNLESQNKKNIEDIGRTQTDDNNTKKEIIRSK